MITVTSICNPAMARKIRTALRGAALGHGDQFDGHGNRAYVKNRHGRNILRLDWKPAIKTFVAYGGCDWGQTEVTDVVKSALRKASAMKAGVIQ